MPYISYRQRQPKHKQVIFPKLLRVRINYMNIRQYKKSQEQTEEPDGHYPQGEESM